MRKFLITAASVASVVAVVGMAPSALASNESVDVVCSGARSVVGQPPWYKCSISRLERVPVVTAS
jgi:hypothetical protein